MSTEAQLVRCQVASDSNGNCTIRTPNGSVISCQERSGGISVARQLMQRLAPDWTEQGRQRGLHRATCSLSGDHLDALVQLGAGDRTGSYAADTIAFVEEHIGRDKADMLRLRSERR